MSKCFIEGMGGGGSGKLFAAIGVTYPEGSACTCTNGTKTLKAKTTSGQWVFAIPDAGTWTVTATDGTDTSSETVEITTEGQSVSVELSYALWLYKAGEQFVENTGGWKAVNGDGTTATFKSDHILFNTFGSAGRDASVYTKNKIDVSDFNTLIVRGNITAVGQYVDCVNIGLTSENTAAEITSWEAKKSIGDEGVFEAQLDVSNISGSYYAAIYVHAGDAKINETELVG